MLTTLNSLEHLHWDTSGATHTLLFSDELQFAYQDLVFLKRGKGMPHAPYRHVLNSLLYILITGCRWCDLPRGET
ncbi:MAG: hypothetical protein MET45_10945 [Nostoc sp. LLA-1]|nr:hypothetical protein [Cyanocohniella sp. LLY]